MATVVIILFLPLLTSNGLAQPVVLNSNLKIDHVFSGQFKPTNMAFLGNNDILVLDRDEGKVYRMLNGNMNPEPVLDAKVATIGYRGMLGIDVMKTKSIVLLFSFTTPNRWGKMGTMSLTKEV